MVIDLHSHSTISDGTLSVEEAVAAAERHGYTALAITDHVTDGTGGYAEIVGEVRAEIERLRPQTRVQLFAGVEITDFPPDRIAWMAQRVRQLGAEVVVVHGECVSMTVIPGTNAAAIRAPGVDILGHPGLVTDEDAVEAARRGIYLELSAKGGHSWANGHVYATARRAAANLIVDSDAHDEVGLLSVSRVHAVLRGAAAGEVDARRVVERDVTVLLRRLMSRALTAS
jgi:histidinol phosphatase-like PHP family hydrolase